MKTTIQVIENSDRFHVSKNGIPQMTFVFGKQYGKPVSRDFAEQSAQSEAYKLTAQLMSEGVRVKVLKQEVK